MIIMDSDILEKLSDLEHRQWCEWSGSVSKDIFSLITILDRFEDDLSDDEKKVMDLLCASPEGVQINILVVKANLPIQRLNSLLFELEMKGMVRALAGGVFKSVSL